MTLGGDRLTFAGDAIFPVGFDHPDWHNGFEYDPEESVRLRPGFRVMAATLLNEMSIWNADAIERQLAHMENNGARRAYTRGEYWEERVPMMQRVGLRRPAS